MGRRSTATLARISNLGHTKESFRAHVEDITDPVDPDFQGNHSKSHAVNLLEEGLFVLDENLDSDSEDEGCEDECADESVTDADIAAFTEILAEAQLAAVKAELVLESPVFWLFDHYFELEHCRQNSPLQLGCRNKNFRGWSGLFPVLGPKKFPFQAPCFHWRILTAVSQLKN
jgi:hypothetical protein